MIFGGKPQPVSSAALEAAQAQINELIAECDKLKDDRAVLTKRLEELRPLRCSFCGHPQQTVKTLVAGPDCFICNECIWTCVEILEGGGHERPTREEIENENRP